MTRSVRRRRLSRRRSAPLPTRTAAVAASLSSPPSFEAMLLRHRLFSCPADGVRRRPSLEAHDQACSHQASTREGVLDSRQFMEDSKVRRLPTPHHDGQRGGWSPHPSNDDRDQGYLKTLKPKSEGQAELLNAIDTHNLILALGPAGTGKTYLAVAKAVEALEAGKVGRIVLSPPRRRGRRIDRLPARRHGGQAGPLSAPALRRPVGPADDEAGQGPDGRGPDRDRPRRLHARPHAEQRLHRHRRGPELHLRAAEDAADPAGLAFDHGRHRRPAARPTCCRGSRACPTSPTAWRPCRRSRSCAWPNRTSSATRWSRA